MYHQDLLDEARNPQNVGELENPDLSTTQFNASCGDVISVDIELSADGSHLKTVRWKGDGCIISQASMSALSSQLEGMDIEHVLHLQQHDLLDFLGLHTISPGRIKCLHLGLQAVKQLLRK